MAENSKVATVMFGLEGGGSIDSGSGALIYSQILEIADAISKKRPKIKLELDSASIKSSKVFQDIMEQLQSINVLVDTISKKEFKTTNFIKHGVSQQVIGEFQDMKVSALSWLKTLDDAASQYLRFASVLSKSLAGTGGQAGELVRYLMNTWGGLRTSLEQRIAKSGSAKGLQSLIDETTPFLNLINDVRAAIEKIPDVSSKINVGELTKPVVFQKETKAIQEENRELDTHAAAVKEATVAEQAKAVAAVGVEGAVAKETIRFSEATEAAQTNAQASRDAADASLAYQKGVANTTLSLEGLQRVLLAMGANPDAVATYIGELRESGIEVVRIKKGYDNLGGTLQRVQFAAEDAAGAIKSVIQAQRIAIEDSDDFTWGLSVTKTIDAKPLQRQVEAEEKAMARLEQMERKYYSDQAERQMEAERQKKMIIDSEIAANERRIAEEERAIARMTQQETRRYTATMDAEWAKEEKAAYDDLIAKTRDYYAILDKIAANPKSTFRDQWDAAKTAAQGALQAAMRTAHAYAQDADSQEAYNEAIRECLVLENKHLEYIERIRVQREASDAAKFAREEKAAYADLIKTTREYYSALRQRDSAPAEERQRWEEAVAGSRKAMEAAQRTAAAYGEETESKEEYADVLRRCTELELQYNTAKIASNNASSVKDERAAYEELLNTTRRYWRLRQSVDTAKTSVRKDELIEQAEAAREAMEAAQASAAGYAHAGEMQREYANTLQQCKDIEMQYKMSTDEQAEGWLNLARSLLTLNPTTEETRRLFDELKDAIQGHYANELTMTLSEATAKFKDLKAAIAANNKEVSIDTTYAKLTNKLTAFYHQYENAIKSNPQLMAMYQSTLDNLSTKSFGAETTRAAQSVQEFTAACEKAGVMTNTFFKRLQSGFGNKLFYGMMARMSMYVRRLARSIFESIKEIDSAMTQLKIVTGATDAQMRNFLESTSELAIKLGKNVSDVMKSIETFSRLGYNLGEASSLAEYATILSNVANVDVSTATTGLTSIIKAFGLQVSDAEHVADVLVNVGQKYAISAEELMSAFERGGAALSASNTSFDQAAAIFAAANASMQNAQKVGTALQTISARIRGAKTELEELGEDYEDVAEGVSKYRDELKALTNIDGKGGIDVYSDADAKKYKDVYTLLTEIAAIWDKIGNDASRQRIAEIFGGNRQYSVVSSIISNIADAEGALNTALNSAGVAMKANETYMESMQGHIGVLKADWQMFAESLNGSGIAKGVIDLADGLVRVVTYLTEIKAIVPAIVAIVSAVKIVKKFQAANAVVSLFVTKLRDAEQLTAGMIAQFTAMNSAQQAQVLTSGIDAKTAAILQQAAALKALSGAELEAGAATLAAQMATAGYTPTVINATLAMYGFQLAENSVGVAAITTTGAVKGLDASLKGLMASNPVGWILMIVGIVASVAIPIISKLIKTTDELKQEYEQEKSELEQLEQQYETNANRIEELLDLKAKGDFSEQNAEELQALKDQNTELALQIEYRRILAEQDNKKIRDKVQTEWTSKSWQIGPAGSAYSAATQYLGTESAMRQGAQKLEQLQTDYNAAVDQLIETGDSEAFQNEVLRIEAAQKDIIQDYEDVFKYYSENLDYLDEATRAALDPVWQAWMSGHIDQYAYTGSAWGKLQDALTGNKGMLLNAASLLHSNKDAVAKDLDLGALEQLAADVRAGKAPIKDYTDQLVAFQNALYGLVRSGLPQETADLVKQLIGAFGIKDELMPRNLAGTAANLLGFGSGGANLIEQFLSGKSYDELEKFLTFLKTVDLTDVTTVQEAIDKFIEWENVVAQGTPAEQLAKKFESLDKVRDSLKLLGEAMKEATEEDSLGVTYSTLSDIAEKFADVEGIETYIDRIAAAGSNSEELQGVLRELAFQYVIASNDAEMLANASDDVITALLREAGVANADKNAIIELKLAMFEANRVNMTFDQQIKALQQLAVEAGIAISMMGEVANFADTTSALDFGGAGLGGEGINFNNYTSVAKAQKNAAMSSYSTLLAAIRKKVQNSLGFSGTDSKDKTGGGGSSAVEDYIADIEKFREAIRKLNLAQEERANIEYKIEHSVDLKEQIALQRQLIGTYNREREALQALNELRDQSIADGVQQLRDLGFVVTYNAEADDFWVENLEHLNELQGKNQEETNQLREDTEELINTLNDLNDENKENAESYRDLSDSIQEAHQKVSELLKDIVAAASDAVDSMQDVYESLHKAAEEYAESGFVTIDTVQSLIELGTEYMSYLLDENGQLVINEERIRKVIAAKMDQLAIENALSYIEALRIAQTNGDIDELNRLLYATEDATDATWGFVYATLALLGLDDDQYQAALHNINAIRSLADASVQSIGDEFSKMKQGMDDILKYVMEMIKQQISDQVDALNDEKKAYADIISQQKESLNLAKKQNDYQKTIRDKLKEMAKLRAQIDALSLDTSREAQAKRIKLEEELAEIQEELAETQNDHAIEAHEEALDNMQESFEAEKDGEIKILEDSISSYQKLYDMA